MRAKVHLDGRERPVSVAQLVVGQEARDGCVERRGRDLDSVPSGNDGGVNLRGLFGCLAGVALSRAPLRSPAVVPEPNEVRPVSRR